ncbi:MAG: glycosyltransferase family 4 protein [Nanoarchaeota archaeon]|nr:glycosyltransferase family 4 protein [Nanoarchaeota archaeon]
MKKLLIATDSFLPRLDGATSFLKEIIPRLEKEYEITVLCPDLGDIKEKFDVKFVRFRPSKFHAEDVILAVPDFSLIRTEVKKADIVWVQGFGTIGTFVFFSARKRNKKIALITHLIEWEIAPKGIKNKLMSSPVNLLVKFIMIRIYNQAKVIMVPSLEIMELLTLLGIRTPKRIVKMGIDTNKFSQPHNKAASKKRIGFSEKDFIIGYIGRLAYVKDLKTIFWAFRRLQKKYSNVKLLIVGGGREELINFFSNKEGITLTGAKDNVVPYYQALDVHVLASLYETANLSTMEAMSCSLPVIATRVGYIREYIKNGKNGYIFQKKDSYALYKKLNLLYNDSKKREEMGQQARKTVVQKFSWEKTVDEIKGVFEEL